jgi:hypothetical protein
MWSLLKSFAGGLLLLTASASVLLAQTSVWWSVGDTPATPAGLQASLSEDPALEELLQGLTPSSTSYATCTSRSTCCKVCDKGKACGNSCISRRYVCHKGHGCACDSAEVCR